jgi:cell division septation protein DedD
MPRTDEGEFELVLGNRQLLSVFFVIVILMGVCFAAGYIIGRNSVGGPAATRLKGGGESAIVVDPTASEAKDDAQRSTPAPGDGELRGAPAGRTTAKPAPAASAPERAPAPPPEPAKPAPAEPKPAAVTGAGLTEPEAGQTYIQVAAVGRKDAEIMVSALRTKDFRASVAPGPSDTLFRVLVGPIKDSAEVNKQRTRLKELGFDPFVKRF